MSKAEQAREAFILVGLVRPGESISLAEQRFAVSIMRHAPFSWWPWKDHTVWLARQLAGIYKLNHERIAEIARC